jgi:hypothetical protein
MAMLSLGLVTLPHVGQLYYTLSGDFRMEALRYNMGCPRVGDCMRLVQRKMKLMAKEVELLQVRWNGIEILETPNVP